MQSFSFLFFLTLAGLLMLSCSQSNTKNTTVELQRQPSYDTAAILILDFGENNSRSIFDSSYRTASLSQQEIAEVDQLYHIGIERYNVGLSKV
jgi:hypothetical protein